MNLILRPPQLSDRKAFESVKDTPVLNNQTFLLNFKPGMSFEQFVRICDDHNVGQNLPPGYVPAAFYFGFVGDRIIGRLTFRWQINDYLLKVAGHIGFVVLPSEQRKGYASEMLRQALIVAREKNFERVLLTCDDDNIASIRTIEKAGGVLENIYTGPEVKIPKRRYWIEVQ